MVASVDQVNQWLLNTWKVVVPQDWLEACISWIHSDQGSSISHNDVCGQVFEQWSVCDLRDIGASCLPLNLAQQPKVELQGAYCLQVISMIDASSPYYTQLQKVKGTVNENVGISCTQQSQAQWQPKTSGNRMMVMTLTDGEQEIHGMEYKTIPSLNNTLGPGFKLTVQGPVICRRGMLMLAPENVTVLGGEVESLVEELTPEKLLTDKLTAHEALLKNAPNNPSKTFDISGNIQRNSSMGGGSSTVQATRGQHSQPSNPPRGRGNPIAPSQRPQWGGPAQRGTGQPRGGGLTRSGGQNSGGGHTRGGGQNRGHGVPANKDQAMEIPDDDILDAIGTEQLDAMENQQWEDDVDLEALMDHFEEEDAFISQGNQRKPPQVRNPPPQPSPEQSSMPPPRNPGRPVARQQPTSHQLPRQPPSEPWKPPHRQEVTSAVTSQNRQVSAAHTPQMFGGTQGMGRGAGLGDTSSASLFGDGTWDDDDFDFDVATAMKPVVKTEPKAEANIVKRDANVFRGETNVFNPPSQCSERPSDTKSAGTAAISTHAGIKSEQSDSKSRPVCSNLDGFRSNSGAIKANRSAAICSPEGTGVPFHRKPLFRQAGQSGSMETGGSPGVVGAVQGRSMFGGPVSVSNQPGVRVKSEPLGASIHPTHPVHAVHSPHPAHAVHSPSEEPCEKRPRLEQEAVTPIMKIGTSTPPYTYLKLVLDQLDDSEVQVVRVKAYISTLVTRMEYNQGSHWSLRAKINDGTATVDVELGDKMLTSLIGFSAPEALKMKAKVRQDPSLKDVFRNAITRCQHSLIQLSCILEIEFSPHRPWPYVRRHLPLSQSDLDQLIKRNNHSPSV